MTTPNTPVQLDRDAVEDQLRGIWNLLTPSDRKLFQAIVDAVGVRSVRITVGNLKGGANKTTTAVHLALALALTGDPVLLIDGDPKNQSALMWKLGAGEDWPVNLTVMPWATPDLAKRVKAMEGQFKHLVIDTSPQHADILEAALMVTDTLVIPCQPTPMDTAQLDSTFKSADKIDMLKDTQGGGLASIVLFVRAKQAGNSDTNLLRKSYDLVQKQDYPAVSKPLYDSLKYAEAFGQFPSSFRGYGPVIAELVTFALDLDEVPGRTGESA
ncbi:AAA family ATPase [Nonomuraea sp. NPDC050786]|uniref:AAA family ATPase n=1 Tax=Nonomuraea sp. NPDC050786 TaxID=3154840 RepID=UPI003405D564